MTHLDLDSLESLDTIIREGSFAKASEVLHKTQSALSYQIRKLETQLGVELLDRSAYRATLTSEGRLLLEEGRKLLRHGRRVQDLAQQLVKGWEPRLELVIDGILPREPIFAALRELGKDAIPTRIRLKTEFLGGVQFRFDRDHADLMLVKAYRHSERLAMTKLPSMKVVLCCSSQHPLANRKQVELWNLQEHVELSVHDSSEASNPAIDQRVFGCERVYFLSDFQAKHEALLAGLGFGWMPLHQAHTDLEQGKLVTIDYQQGATYQFEPRLVHRLDRELGPAGKKFGELIRTHWTRWNQRQLAAGSS